MTVWKFGLRSALCLSIAFSQACDDDSAGVPGTRGIPFEQLTSGGGYVATCQPYREGFATGHLTLNPDRTGFFQFDVFYDSSCLIRIVSLSANGTFELSTDGETLEVRGQQGTLIPWSQEMTFALNEEGWCGILWVAGQMHDLAAGHCWGDVRRASWKIRGTGVNGSRIELVDDQPLRADRLSLKKETR